jgi:hypothetical protein
MKSKKKSAKIEIDQSGRIEETNRDTILAYSNGKSYSIIIPARTKRQLLEQFRILGKPKIFVLRVFASGIYLLINDQITKCFDITIDIEYPGNNHLISDMLKEMFIRNNKDISKINFSFSLIGKKSRAHNLAISVFRKKEKADKIIKYSELRELAIKKSR